MVNSPKAAADLDELAPHLERTGVTLALETYEQIATADLVALVTGRQNVGICLDPANTVSILEHPQTVIEMAAPHTANVHVKDFTFTRAEGWGGVQPRGHHPRRRTAPARRDARRDPRRQSHRRALAALAGGRRNDLPRSSATGPDTASRC